MPQQLGYTLRNYRAICNVVLIGSYAVVAAICALLIVSFHMGDAHVLDLIAVCGVALLYIAATQLLARWNHHHAVAYLLVSFYALLGGGIVWSWGINTPIGTLILALVIVLAGILLAARHALFAAIGVVLILVGVQTAAILHWHEPDMSWSGRTSSFGDVAGYAVVFGMLALVSWLYNREMERSLTQAKQAEAALMQQKATLKLRVEQRTAELRQVQLEEMQQMYRFAELGQLGVTLLHDLANHLTALILEVDGIESRQHSKDISRAREIILYLEDVVAKTRGRLHGSTESRTFNIIQKTSEALAFLQYKAAKAGVKIDWEPPAKSWSYTGDPTCYCQVVAVITNNAIDAYAASRGKAIPLSPRCVAITMQQSATHIIVKISDWGGGITKAERKHLFKPYHSTKKSGLGLGLYIARQTVEMQFSGSVDINPRSKHTEFVIKLPRGYEK